MRASSSSLARVCNIKKFDMDLFLKANNIEGIEVTFTSQDDGTISYKSYDTLEVVKLFDVYLKNKAKEDESKYKIPSIEIDEDEIPF